MIKKVVVSASSMPAGRNMSSQVEYLERVGNYGADMYHFDVIDGEFVKTKTIDHKYLEQLKEHSTLLFDVHLMVNNPDKVLDKYFKAGADIITIHYEVFEDKELLVKTLKRIKKHKKMAGLAIDIDTNIEVLDTILKYIDILLVMCVKAGKGGQEFNSKALQKIKYARALSPALIIEADGGINEKTAPQCVKAGADVLVSGSYIYNNDTYIAIQTLKGQNG